MKIIEKAGQVFLYTGSGIFILGFAVTNYTWYFLIPGALIAGLGIYILWFLQKKEDDTSISQFNDWRDKLISTGKLIEVPPDKCEIKSSTYIKEKEVDFDSHNREVHNAVFGEPQTAMDNKDQNIIKFSTVLNGEQITFISPIIYKQSDTLEFLLASRTTTKLYVDQTNIENFYWDLEFLKGS